MSNLALTAAPRGVLINALTHPLRGEVSQAIAIEGMSLAEMLGDAAPAVHVWVGAVRVERRYWKHVRPKASAVVTVRVLASGSGNKGLRTVLQVVVLAASIYTAGLGTTLGYQLGAAGVSVLGNLAINALLPPQLPQLGESPSSFNRLRSLTGTQNQANPFGAVPRVYGRHKFYPPFAARPYTEIMGERQFLRVLLCLGYGPLNVTDIKIGETPIGNYEDVTYEVTQTPTLFTTEVFEENLAVTFPGHNVFDASSNEPVSRTTQPGTTEISVDLMFPQGISVFDTSGNRVSSWAGVSIGYRLAGSGAAYQFPNLTPNVQYSGNNIYSFTDTYPDSTWVEASTFDTVRASVKWPVPAGQYEVAVSFQGNSRKISDEIGFGNNRPGILIYAPTNTLAVSASIGDMVWTALRSVLPTNKAPTPGFYYLAARIRATDQLQGLADSINCIAESILNVWDGAAFVLQATHNPAWVLLDMACGSATERALDRNTRFWLADIKAWADDNTANGREYNAVIDGRSTVFELMRDVAAVGRASFAQRDGKYTVVRDVPGAATVQHFTPRNSWGFSGERRFQDLPHALRVRFVNPDNGWQQDEIIVYDDGYSAANATRFEQLELRGVTTASQAWKDGRYNLAAARLRPETYSLTCDIENLVAQRGDVVRLSHDVISSGMAWGRIKAIAGDVLTLDETVTMVAGGIYAIRVRKTDNSGVVQAVITAPGDTNVVTLALAVAGLNVGDLFMFGYANTESISCKITKVVPGPDYTARLTLVDEAPAVLLADSGTPPPFQSSIGVSTGQPETPRIYNARSDETVLLIANDGSLQSRILVHFGFLSNGKPLPAQVECQYRFAGLDPWRSLPPVTGAAGSVSVQPVDDGVAYELRLRSIAADGVMSDWSPSTGHTVVGKTSVPPDVPSLYINGSTLNWDYPNPPRDLAGFRVRHQSGINNSWVNGIDVHPGLIGAPPYQLNIPGGMRTILIKAVDVAGFESVHAAAITVDLGEPLTDNLIFTKDYQALGYPGTLTNATVDLGRIKAAEELALFWSGNDSDLFWDGMGSDLFWGTLYNAFSYEFSFIPETDATGPASILSLLPVVTAQLWTIEYRVDGTQNFWGNDDSEPFWTGADTELFWGASTDDWRPWPGSLGGVARQQYNFRIAGSGGVIQGIIDGVTVITDMPDVIENFGDVVVSAAGVRLPITRSYRRIVNVNLTLQDDGGTAATIKTIDKDISAGPLIKAFDSAGLPTTASIDAIVQGY